MKANRARWYDFCGVAVIFLAFIGIAVATRRTIVLLKPGALSARNNPAQIWTARSRIAEL